MIYGPEDLERVAAAVREVCARVAEGTPCATMKVSYTVGGSLVRWIDSAELAKYLRNLTPTDLLARAALVKAPQQGLGLK